MSVSVQFGLTFKKPTTNPIKPTDMLKKLQTAVHNVSNIKAAANLKEENEIKDSLEKVKSKIAEKSLGIFGALTDIDESYYRPFEKIANRLEYAQTEEEESKNEIKLTPKNVSEELEEFGKILEKAEASCN